ncbi:hypothetical protein GYMLUDRAFT_39502 [Collybiopsis luxurians FD-317 M1]|nr:hypothetical protein GYMLUDRAFT_39502 [Collybiopsis luxurians FD-317 M1]
MRQAGWTVEAWEDALNRCQIEATERKDPWTDIFSPQIMPQRGESSNETTDEDGDSDAEVIYENEDCNAMVTDKGEDCAAVAIEEDGDHDAINGGNNLPKPKRKSKTTAAPPGSGSGSNRRERGGGPGGGGPGDGGSAAGGRGGGSNSRGSRHSKKRFHREDSPPARSNYDKRQQALTDKEPKIDLIEMHLAFSCPEAKLESTGFSRYTLVPLPAPGMFTGGAFSRIELSSAVTLHSQSVNIAGSTASGGSNSAPRSGPPSLTGSSSSSDGSTASALSSTGSMSALPPSLDAMSISSPPMDRPAALSKYLESMDNRQSSDPHISDHNGSKTVVRHAGVILTSKVHLEPDQESSMGIVWGGKLYLEGVGATHEPLQVVVKLVDWEMDSELEGKRSHGGKAVRREGRAYQYLARGAPNSDITPRFYGVFEDSGSIALVLGGGGERLHDFCALTIDSKLQLFRKACELHELGVKHGDLSAQNVLIDDKSCLRIDNFCRSKLDHECSGPADCDELQQLFEDLELQEKS